MPWGLNRFQESRQLHFLTFSCFHRNPVKRGPVAQPEDWPWSSFRHYLTGEASAVEIESQWTARRREQLGIFPTAGMRPAEEEPRPSEAWTGHLRE